MTTALFSGTGPLVLFLVKATLVLILAIAATFLLRRSTAGERHLVWLGALVGVLALPLLSRIPALQLGILPSRLTPASVALIDGPPAILFVNEARTSVPTAIAPAIGAPTIEDAQTVSIARTNGTTIVIAQGRNTTVAPEAAPAIAPAELPELPATYLSGSILQTIAIVWAAVALSLLTWLAFGALQVRRILATSTDLTSPDWTMPLCEVADRLDLEQPPRLVMSDRIEMAFACRLLAPTVVLPMAAEAWTDERRRAVLFHELAHVKRHDLVSHMLGRIACALYWFHPLVWTAARSLRNESEKACDDLVLSCGARASDYAQHLLDMVTSVRNHGAPALGIPMARKKEFEGRMLAILDPAIRRVSRSRLHAAGVIAGVSALSLTIAAVSPAKSNAAELEASVNADLQNGAAQARRAASVDDELSARPAPRAYAAATEAYGRSASVATRSETIAVASAARSMSTSTSTAPSASASAAPATAASFGRAIGILAGTATKEALQSLLVTPTASQGTEADTARVALLIKVLKTDSDAGVRRAAAWGLSDVGTAGARSALTKALQSDDDGEVREMSAWALGEHGVTQDGSAALGNALVHDKSAKVRRTSAWALGQAGRRGDSDALVSGVSDSDADVRETSIWALGQLDLTRAPQTLINSLSDGSPRVREITAWALGQIGDTTAVRPLTRAFNAESDAKIKRMYLWSLAQIGNAPTDLIESAMKSSDPELRRHAVALLTDTHDSWPMPMPRPQPRPRP